MKLTAKQTLVRTAEEADCVTLTSLIAQLGFPANQEEVAERLRQIKARAHDQALFVVEIDLEVVGFIQVGLRTTLATPRSAEIYELVVNSSYRSHGLGSLLVAQAETWGRSLNCEQMIVRSRVDRERAHQFYQTRGYTIHKTQQVFGKQLSES